MLILTRKSQESINLYSEDGAKVAEIVVLHAYGPVKIGIGAPKEISIIRSEIDGTERDLRSHKGRSGDGL